MSLRTHDNELPGADWREHRAGAKRIGPVTAHVYHPLETRRYVVALHVEDLERLAVQDHDWVRVWSVHQQPEQSALARVENADYRRGMTAKPVRTGHPRLSRALRSRVEISRRRFPEHEEKVFIGSDGLEASSAVLGVVYPEPGHESSTIWLDPRLEVPTGTWVEVEHPDVDGHGRRIRGHAEDYVTTVTQLNGADTRYVALTRFQQALLGLDADALQPGTDISLPELVMRPVPLDDLPSSRPPRALVRELARLAVGESNVMAESRLGSHLDALTGVARLSRNLYEALGLTEGDWVHVHDGRRTIYRRAAVESADVGAAPYSSGQERDVSGNRRDQEEIGVIWLDGEALGELDLRRSGDSVLVGRDPIQTVRSAVGDNVLSAVLAFATVVVIGQSLIAVIAAVIAAVLVLYIAFAKQRARVRRTA